MTTNTILFNDVKLTEFRCTRIDCFPRNSMRQSLWSSCAFKATLSSIYDMIDFITVWETDTAWIGLNTHIYQQPNLGHESCIYVWRISPLDEPHVPTHAKKEPGSVTSSREKTFLLLSQLPDSSVNIFILSKMQNVTSETSRESKDWEKQQQSSSSQMLSCAQWFIFLDNEKVNRLTELPNMAHCVSRRQSDLELATLQSLIWT